MHHPRKRFGQHFLHDALVIEQIIDAIAPQRTDHIIEIGPGKGALTVPLLKYLDHLDVIELDKDLVPLLQKKCADSQKLTIYQSDALLFDFSSLAVKKLVRLVGNLPYNISTPLLFHLLSYHNVIQDMTFMLQQEVAERLTAQIGTADYGRLSVMLQYHFSMEILFTVPPDAFYPPPKVNSAIVYFAPCINKFDPVLQWQTFSDIVREAFQQRRKTLRNCLRQLINTNEFEKLEINDSLRPEQLSINDFVKIANYISNNKG